MEYILAYITLALLIIGISVFVYTKSAIESLSTRIMISFISAIIFAPVTKIAAIIVMLVLLLVIKLAHIPIEFKEIDERHYHIAGEIWIITTYLSTRIANKVWLEKQKKT